MPSRFRSVVLLCLTAAVFLLGGCRQVQALSPQAVSGFLDLSAWNFNAGGTVRLDGEWAFYWRRLLTPQDFQQGEPAPPNGYVAAPGGWSGAKVAGAPLPIDGYATFRLRVKLPEPNSIMAVRVPYMCMAYRLWVDGDLIAANGVVGTSQETEVPQTRPVTAYFTPHTAADTVELVAQVSNFHHRCNGLWSSLSLGTADQVNQAEAYSLAAQMVLFGSILVMAFYHLGLFLLRRNDRSPLYFGLFCVLIAARMLVTDEMFLIRLFPAFPWELQQRIEYLTGYLALPMFFLLLRALYPQEMPRRDVRLAQAVALLGCATLLAPGRISSLFIVPYEIILPVFVAHATTVMVQATLRRRDGAALFLGGAAFFFVTLINDLLNYNLLMQTGQFMPLGLFVLILAQSVILAQRYAHVFSELQRSRRMLTEREEHLRKEIAEMLHGRVQTRLLLAGYRMREAERLLDAGQGEIRALLAATREEVDHVRQEDVRQASHLLHPSIIRVGLVPAVRSLASRFNDHFQATVQVDPGLVEYESAVDGGLPETVRLAAYRILEEALNNVMAHAGASRVEVLLGITPERQLWISVRDDGRGVDPSRLEPGLGLRSVAARVTEMGGAWEITGRPGQGTVLSVRLPLEGGLC